MRLKLGCPFFEVGDANGKLEKVFCMFVRFFGLCACLARSYWQRLVSLVILTKIALLMMVSGSCLYIRICVILNA